MPDLSVSIVAYRTPELLRQCLAALAAERAGIEFDVTVVDNASDDQTLDLLHAEFAWVRVIANSRNRGFAAAHNQALSQASGRYWMLLNSDAKPLPGSTR